MAGGEGENQLPFIVSVWSGDGITKKDFCGTGILINSTTVLTCKHVVHKALELKNGGRHALRVWYHSRSGEGWVASSHEVHNADDIAFIRLELDTAGEHQTPYPKILTEVTDSALSCLKSSQQFSSCRVQGYPDSKDGREQYLCKIQGTELSEPTSSAKTGTIVDGKLKHQGVKNGMSGSPVLIQNAGEWYLWGMAYLGGGGATDSVFYFTQIITEFLDTHEVQYEKLSLQEFLTPAAEIVRKQKDAKSRLKNEIVSILGRDASLQQDLHKGIQQRGVHVATSDPQNLADCIIGLSVDNFVLVCTVLVKEYKRAGKEALSALLTALYWTTLAASMDPQRVEECQQLLFSAASVGGVVLIPSSDRTILELIMAGVDGRAPKLRVPGPNQLPCSQNELNIENIPESGISPKGHEIDKTLSERLGIRGWKEANPKTLRSRVCSYLKHRVDTNDRMFAVIRSWSEKTAGVVDKTNLKDLLQADFSDLVWIDTVGDEDTTSPDVYMNVLNPLHDGFLEPQQ